MNKYRRYTPGMYSDEEAQLVGDKVKDDEDDVDDHLGDDYNRKQLLRTSCHHNCPRTYSCDTNHHNNHAGDSSERYSSGRDSSESDIDNSEHEEYDDECSECSSENNGRDQEGELMIADYGSSGNEYEEELDDNTNPVVGMDPYHEDDDCAMYECKFFLCNDCQPM